jgi:hypothetical protein
LFLQNDMIRSGIGLGVCKTAGENKSAQDEKVLTSSHLHIKGAFDLFATLSKCQ